MVAVQQPHKYKTPRLVSLEGNTFQNFATYISFIIWVTQQKYQFFCRFLLENLTSGAPTKSRGWKIFVKKDKRGEGTRIRDLRVE